MKIMVIDGNSIYSTARLRYPAADQPGTAYQRRIRLYGYAVQTAGIEERPDRTIVCFDVKKGKDLPPP